MRAAAFRFWTDDVKFFFFFFFFFGGGGGGGGGGGKKAGLPARSLWQHEETDQHQYGDDGEASGRLNARPPWVERLVEEVADRGAERARQDEGRPEQEDARHMVQ